VGHRFWRNIGQPPHHALVPTLVASTAITQKKITRKQKAMSYEISYREEILTNVMRMRLSVPLGFDLYLPV
jgi:hypothetical protein